MLYAIMKMKAREGTTIALRQCPVCHHRADRYLVTDDRLRPNGGTPCGGVSPAHASDPVGRSRGQTQRPRASSGTLLHCLGKVKGETHGRMREKGKDVSSFADATLIGIQSGARDIILSPASRSSGLPLSGRQNCHLDALCVSALNA